MGNNSSSKSTDRSDPENCLCRTTEFKLKWCECGRSKPSYEPPEKRRFWTESEKTHSYGRYNSIEISNQEKSANDYDPGYEKFVRGLEESKEKRKRDANK